MYGEANASCPPLNTAPPITSPPGKPLQSPDATPLTTALCRTPLGLLRSPLPTSDVLRCSPLPSGELSHQSQPPLGPPHFVPSHSFITPRAVPQANCLEGEGKQLTEVLFISSTEWQRNNILRTDNHRVYSDKHGPNLRVC